MSLEGFKWTLVALMVVDHIAVAFQLPFEWRLPGRVVMPGFLALLTYHLAQGVSPEKYLARLVPFALISQPGYSLVFQYHPLSLWPLNILADLSASVLAAGGQRAWLGWVLGVYNLTPAMPLAVVWSLRGMRLLAGAVLALNLWMLGWPLWVGLLEGGAYLLFLHLVPRLGKGRRTPWWAFYAVYPAHLYAIYLVKRFLEG